jgi:membrane protein DedA with SNARE-associated domain/rhodanese-related sulfurtransferase
MDATIQFLLRHGYIVLFFWVLAEQAGLPFPVLPLLLAAGSLAAVGKLNMTAAVLISVLACIVADVAWYAIGRRFGANVLRWMCRISLEPDSCVRRTKSVYTRHGEYTLAVSKFVPGLSAVLAPLSGVTGLRFSRFLLFDGAGAFLWSGTYLLVGYMLSRQLTMIAHYGMRMGEGFFALLAAGLVVYILVKYIQRRRFMKTLRGARIEAQELKDMVDAGEEVLIVDLRQSFDLAADPQQIPGSVRLDPSDIEDHVDLIPRDREIVLYCTCPNEATSARVALLLRKHGIDRVRPLNGGIDGWRQLDFPVEPVKI